MAGRAWLAALALVVASRHPGRLPPDAHDAAPQDERLYSPDPADPWNRIHHLLFTRRLKVAVLGKPDEPARALERVEGGDLPEFMVMPEADYLLEAARYGDLVEALQAEIAAPSVATRSLAARVMFQQDLWNRFDAVHLFLSSEHPDDTRARARRLRELLGRAMRMAACRLDELTSLRPAFADAARAFPQVLDPGTFASGSGWRELVSTAGDVAVDADTTNHARRAGYRIVFRRFARVPEADGELCLQQAVSLDPLRFEKHGGCFDGTLPEGARAVLLETALAVTREGEIVATPLVLGLQSRTVSSPGVFDVLHASRKALASPNAADSGLLALPHDALIPMTASAFQRASGQALVPMPMSCSACHGVRGEVLGTNRLMMRPRTQVMLPGNTVEQDRVVRAKRTDGSYEALRALFADDGSSTHARGFGGSRVTLRESQTEPFRQPLPAPGRLR